MQRYLCFWSPGAAAGGAAGGSSRRAGRGRGRQQDAAMRLLQPGGPQPPHLPRPQGEPHADISPVTGVQICNHSAVYEAGMPAALMAELVARKTNVVNGQSVDWSRSAAEATGSFK